MTRKVCSVSNNSYQGGGQSSNMNFGSTATFPKEKDEEKKLSNYETALLTGGMPKLVTDTYFNTTTGSEINGIRNNYYSQNQSSSTGFGNNDFTQQPSDNFFSTTKPSTGVSGKTFALVEGTTAALALTGFGLFAGSKIKMNKAGKTINEALLNVGEKACKSMQEGIGKLTEIATKDKLSGMYNRRAFDSALAKSFEEAVSGKKDLHGAILDMDFFKSVNEVLGHQVGDEFIAAIGKNVDEVTQKHGIKGYRYGGEEFAIIMPGQSAANSQKIIQEIAEGIKSDKNIQKYQKEFLATAKKQLKKFQEEQKTIDAFWVNLRHEKNQSKLAKKALELLGENPKIEGKNLQAKLDKAVVELNDIARNKSKKKVIEVINDYKNNQDSPIISSVLNQRHNKAKEIFARDEWIRHVIENKGFTISGGITRNIDGDNAQSFFKRADKNLEGAKEEGRNKIIFK